VLSYGVNSSVVRDGSRRFLYTSEVGRLARYR